MKEKWRVWPVVARLISGILPSLIPPVPELPHHGRVAEYDADERQHKLGYVGEGAVDGAHQAEPALRAAVNLIR